MHEFFQQLEQVRHLNRPVALATLVNTVGTSPRKEGAKMWVGEGGGILGSVTIGGCVDAFVIEQAEAVLADQVPRLIELPLGDEDAWELGLSCAGTIEVFIEPLRAAHSQHFDLYTALKSHLDCGAAGALLTSVDGAAMGAKLLLLDDGTTFGSLGDPALEQEVCKAALAHMAQGQSRTLSFALPHTTARVFV
jgi:xanthine dehydrogenase accessory factor